MSAPVAIQHRHDWPIIITGATLLTVHAGFVNAVSFFSLGSPVSHMTGHYTALGMLTEQERFRDAVWVFGLMVSFCIGAMISGASIGQSKFIASQPYGKMMLAVCFIEVISTLLLSYFDHDLYILYPLALACGLQNAMCTTWSGAVVRTTHFTGTITDTGLVIGHWIRYKLHLQEEWEPAAADTWKLMLFFPMMVGFVTGAFLGTLIFNYLDYWALLFPAISIGIVGLIYRWLKRESKYFAYYRYKKVLRKKLGLKEEKSAEDSLLIPFSMKGKVYPHRKKAVPQPEQLIELEEPVAEGEAEVIELDELEKEAQEAERDEEEYLLYHSLQDQQDAYEEQRQKHPELYGSNDRV